MRSNESARTVLNAMALPSEVGSRNRKTSATPPPKSLSNRSFTRIARVSNSFENMSSLTGSYSRRICVRTFEVMSSFRLRVQHADIVPLDDQLVNLLQAEVPAASAVIVAPVLVFSDFQCSRFVAVVFPHGCCFPKYDPPSMLEIPQSSADPPFLGSFDERGSIPLTEYSIFR